VNKFLDRNYSLPKFVMEPQNLGIDNISLPVCALSKAKGM